MTMIVPYSASAVVRVHSALNGWFRVDGRSPSYREITLMSNVQGGRVRRYLDQLQDQGVLTHQRGVPRSIVMTKRVANLSDVELELECIDRSWTVTKPLPVASSIGAAYPVAAEAMDCEAGLLEQLDYADRTDSTAAPIGC